MSDHIRLSHLPNGIRFVSDSIKDVKTITIGCWLNKGTRDESKEINGAAHFLEHMAFKGTHTRTARQIAEEIEAVGGYMNAYTSRERTAYYIRALSQDTKLALDILSDILINPSFDDIEFERERSVILQEIGQCEDTPDDVIFDRFSALCYPDDAMGWPILGEVETIKTIRKEQVKAFMQNHYGGENMVIAIAGDVDHDALRPQIEDFFKDLPAKTTRQASLTTPPIFQQGEWREERDNEQLHIVYGYQGIGICDENYMSLNLLNQIVGGGMASRLFQRIREEMGLAYTIFSSDISASDSGLFAIYAGTSPKDASLLLPALQEEMDKLQHHITPQETMRAKAQIKAGLMMAQESTTNRAERLAHHLHNFSRLISDEELIDKIDKISTDEIQDLAHQLFSQPANLAAIGPLSHLPKL